MDVVVSSQDDSKVTWFKGDGAGNFGTANVVTTSCNACRQVVAFDLNADGWIDLIAAEGGSKTVSIFINPTADAVGLISNDWNTNLGTSPPSGFSFELSKAVSQIRSVTTIPVHTQARRPTPNATTFTITIAPLRTPLQVGLRRRRERGRASGRAHS